MSCVRPAVVTGVLAQLQELLDVEMPRLEVRAHGALALAPWFTATAVSFTTFEERHHALATCRWCP
jgi:hypothetical protein